MFNGANERIRTADLRITSALLYQLSHIGKMQFRRTWRLIIAKASNLHKDFFQYHVSSCAGRMQLWWGQQCRLHQHRGWRLLQNP